MSEQLTREQVLSMDAGRELDALVAEKVMGLTNLHWMSGQLHYGAEHEMNLLPDYSTDISAAWEVVEKMGDCLHLKEHGAEGEWEALFCGFSESKAHGETAQLAISRSALLAVMGL